MQKIVTTILIVFSIALFSKAQEQSQRVHLKSGETFTGTVLENIEGKVLKLKINEKDVMTFRWEEIDTTYAISTANLNDWEKTQHFFSSMRRLKAKGYSGVLNLGFTSMTNASTNFENYGADWSGNGGYVGYYFHFDISHGYRFNPYFALRAGGGVEMGKALMVPVFGEVQFNALKRRLTPILVLSPGYAFCFDREPRVYEYYNPLHSRGGGFYFAGNAGIRCAFYGGSAIQITVGLRYQSVSDDNASATVYGYHLRVGMEF